MNSRMLTLCLGSIGVWVQATAACIEGPNAAPGEIPSTATPIGDTGIYFADGEKSDIPEQSAVADAPTVAYVGSATQTGGNTFKLVIEVDSAYPVLYLYFDFGPHGTYVAGFETNGVPGFAACDALESSAGYGCTDACLKACDCVYCPDPTMEESFEGACAANCSVASVEGSLELAPYYGSAATYADVIYNGGGGVSGVISGTSCEASACGGQAEQVQVLEVGFYVQEWPNLLPPMSVVAEVSSAANSESLVSGSYAAGELTIDRCTGGECR